MIRASCIARWAPPWTRCVSPFRLRRSCVPAGFATDFFLAVFVADFVAAPVAAFFAPCFLPPFAALAGIRLLLGAPLARAIAQLPNIDSSNASNLLSGREFAKALHGGAHHVHRIMRP